MKQDLYQTFNTLRILVGFLGEKNQCDWWDTNFLGSIGLKYLAINFPRSTLAAGCNSVTEAARHLHDERIGKGGVYHLFRMPAAVEESLHKTLIEMDSEHVKAALQDKNAAMHRLKAFMKNSVSSPEGPVQLGTTRELLTDFAVAELSMHYYDAFFSGKKCFPYFSDNQKW